MNYEDIQKDLSVRTKKGVSMYYVGTVYWLLLGIIGFIQMHPKLLGLIYLIGAGMIFPLGILVSKVMKIDLFANNNPLSTLSGVLGGMQVLFAPILIIIFMEKVEWLPFFVAVLTGAHFLPFAILYKSNAIFFLTFGVVGFASIVGFFFMESVYLILPFGLSVIYLITTLLVNGELKKMKSV
ncbi:DUF7010 family protein [Ureibacillus acetophenoni]|uniref:DUF308 domain-containing protein n=1 Tax=Ureibacillus acetophenoni TaxID=614649 RepID=A0A285UF90_9BACL|nr:hypothetical protein [Ureibacillus acetophenoni]SOC39246.1 hypothetical protein SAMN05877842_105123 [Ureibacillus acetophenoni]